MSDHVQQLAALRHELDTLKVALHSAADADERLQIRARINACLRAYLQLLDARLQTVLMAPPVRASGTSDSSQ